MSARKAAKRRTKAHKSPATDGPIPFDVTVRAAERSGIPRDTRTTAQRLEGSQQVGRTLGSALEVEWQKQDDAAELQLEVLHTLAELGRDLGFVLYDLNQLDGQVDWAKEQMETPGADLTHVLKEVADFTHSHVDTLRKRIGDLFGMICAGDGQANDVYVALKRHPRREAQS